LPGAQGLDDSRSLEYGGRHLNGQGAGQVLVNAGHVPQLYRHAQGRESPAAGQKPVNQDRGLTAIGQVPFMASVVLRTPVPEVAQEFKAHRVGLRDPGVVEQGHDVRCPVLSRTGTGALQIRSRLTTVLAMVVQRMPCSARGAIRSMLPWWMKPPPVSMLRPEKPNRLLSTICSTGRYPCR
jgi:hypothetical protein